MPIQIGGQVDVNAPRERVWEMIFDLDTMRSVIGRIPGITLERLDQTGELTYELTAIVGVAAIKGKYDGKINILEKEEPAHVKIKGEGKGGGNFTSGNVSLDLSEITPSTTLMKYSGVGNLNGPLASLGQRLVDTVGKQFIDQGAKIFASEIESRVVPVSETGEALEPAHVEPPAPYGFFFQVFVGLVVLAVIVVLVVLLIIQTS